MIKMHGSLISNPGVCSDDGRAYNVYYDLYTRDASLAGTDSFWNEAKFFNTKEEAEIYCSAHNIEIVKRSSN